MISSSGGDHGTITDEGTKVTSIYGERKVKVYGIHEPELNTISFTNTVSVIFFSVGSFCLENIIKDYPLTWGSLLETEVIATIAFFVFGLYLMLTSKSTIKKVKESHIENQK